MSMAVAVSMHVAAANTVSALFPSVAGPGGASATEVAADPHQALRDAAAQVILRSVALEKARWCL